MLPDGFVAHAPCYTGGMFYSPAEWAIQQFGGVRALARAVGRHPQAVQQWRDKRRHGSQPDEIGDLPPRIQRRVLHLAQERGLDIRADDLIWGRTLAEAGVPPVATPAES